MLLQLCCNRAATETLQRWLLSIFSHVLMRGSTEQATWKQLMQASPCDGFCDEHPEVETHLKLLYTAVTRSQRRLNFVETACSKAASAFFRRFQEQGKLVKLASDSTELTLATGIMSPDEWIHRGLEFACKTWECRPQDSDRGGGCRRREPGDGG
jgi:hypothetical protein